MCLGIIFGTGDAMCCVSEKVYQLSCWCIVQIESTSSLCSAGLGDVNVKVCKFSMQTFESKIIDLATKFRLLKLNIVFYGNIIIIAKSLSIKGP
jgi:hypothetical protein